MYILGNLVTKIHYFSPLNGILAHNSEQSIKEERGPYKELKLPALPPKSPRSGVTFHIVENVLSLCPISLKRLYFWNVLCVRTSKFGNESESKAGSSVFS